MLLEMESIIMLKILIKNLKIILFKEIILTTSDFLIHLLNYIDFSIHLLKTVPHVA